MIALGVKCSQACVSSRRLLACLLMQVPSSPFTALLQGSEFPWFPKPVNILNEQSLDCVNEGPTMILVCDSEELDVAEAKGREVLWEVATASKAESSDEVSFLYGLRGDDLMTRILAFAGIEVEAGSGDRLVLLDLPSGQIYDEKDAATKESAAKIVRDLLAGSLQTTQLKQDDEEEEDEE
jgi:hypothetical protein